MADPLAVNRMQNLISQWEGESDHRSIYLSCCCMMAENMLTAVERRDFSDPDWVKRLLARPDWEWLVWSSRWSRHIWAWTAAVILALLLGAFLSLPAYLIEFDALIQKITASVGLLILLYAMPPGVRKHNASVTRVCGILVPLYDLLGGENECLLQF